MFEKLRLRFTPWGRKQAACEATGTRYYGDGGTVHSAGRLDIETDQTGRVVAVWFRCQALPFRVTTVSWSRADTMNAMYRDQKLSKLSIRGLEVQDAPTQET